MSILLSPEADVLGNLCRRGRNQPQHMLKQMQALPPSPGAGTPGFEPPQSKPDVRLMPAMGEAPHSPLSHQPPVGSVSHLRRAVCQDLPRSQRFCSCISHRSPAWLWEGRAAILTLEVSDEGHWLYCIAAVGKSLDRVVLHNAHHAKASLLTWSRRGEDRTLGTNPGEMEAVQGTGDLWSNTAQPHSVFPTSAVLQYSSGASQVRRDQHTSPQLAQPQSQYQPLQPPQTRQHPCGWKTGHRYSLEEPTGRP